MSGSKGYTVLLAVWLVAGCASAPEQSARNEGIAESAEIRTAAVQSDEVTPTQVVNLNETAQAPENEVVCREMLKQGSNVIVQRCMTRADWERFQRAQARDARQIVRMLQGSPYR